MSTHLIIQRLQQVEAVMREHGHWQTHAPAAEAFNSTQPFCLDTLQPLEWLQWVLLPRMQARLDAGAALPQNFAVTPYYEMALPPTTPGHAALLLTLSQLDALFAPPDV
ncbi:YqcC family protein [Pantoea dispersa]|uniref:YqcC family protein n=1 Tax=Pantoea dispersa TaxID=59814 RepID=UPI000F66F70C|nr:YqcC family protein [Pantoea dispersa]RRW71866.1 YqcC family protein [Pantoea dispersa]